MLTELPKPKEPVMAELNIRDAKESDLEEIQQLYKDSYSQNRELGFPCSVENVSTDDLRQWMNAERLWVAEIQGSIVGAVRLRDLDKKSPTLCRLGVASKYKGAKIGTQLMDFVEKYSKEKGYAGVSLSVAKDHPFLSKIYQKRGYEFGALKPYDLYDEVYMHLKF